MVSRATQSVGRVKQHHPQGLDEIHRAQYPTTWVLTALCTEVGQSRCTISIVTANAVRTIPTDFLEEADVADKIFLESPWVVLSSVYQNGLAWGSGSL